MRVAAHFDRHGEPDLASTLYGIACFGDAAPTDDGDPHELLLAGSLLHGRGQVRTAERIYRHLLKGPSPPADVYSLLGYALHQLGHSVEGARQAAMAVALNPRLPNHHNHFGLALEGQGREQWDEAVNAYGRALELQPGHPEALDNIMRVLLASDTLHPMAGEIGRFLEEGHAAGVKWIDLGRVFEKHRRHEEAARAFARAVASMPGDVAPWLHLGALHQNHKLLEEAAVAYRRVIELEPGHASARERLADCLCEMGEFDQGMAILTALHQEHPSPELQARIDFAFPCIPDSLAQIDLSRRRLEAALDAYLARQGAVPPILSPGFFYLAYHGRNDRDLQRKGALLARKSMPQLIHEAPWVADYAGPGEKIRIGIASSLFHNHSIGRTTRGIVEKLDRARFEVALVCLPPRHGDAMAQAMRASADRVIDLSGDLAPDRETLATQRFDAIFYPDIGMNPYQTMLAHARLAPLQCTHFGHPETNGIPTIDWWISVDALEPPDAADHYSEHLHLLRDVPQFSYYHRPQLPTVLKTRSDYGFDDDDHLHICPQYLFKVHPDFDPILERILREDPKARILFTRSPVGHWSEVILRRLERRMGRLVERITCLPGLAMPDLMNLERVCDGVLDTIHFNGYNTTLEAWAAGAPVVTMAGRFQRGMHTAGMYRFMGMEDLIATDAADYVRLVRRLSEDAGFNRAMRRRIAECCDVLFENMDVVRAYEHFFEEKLRDRDWRRPRDAHPLAEVASPKAFATGRPTAVAA